MSSPGIDPEFVSAYVVASGDGDRCGLSALLAAISSRRQDATEDEVFDACLTACLTLTRNEQVILEMTPPHANRPGRGGYTVIDGEAVPAILGDRASWRAPKEERAQYWLIATESGKAHYISDDIVSL